METPETVQTSCNQSSVVTVDPTGLYQVGTARTQVGKTVGLPLDDGVRENTWT